MLLHQVTAVFEDLETADLGSLYDDAAAKSFRQKTTFVIKPEDGKFLVCYTKNMRRVKVGLISADELEKSFVKLGSSKTDAEGFDEYKSSTEILVSIYDGERVSTPQGILNTGDGICKSNGKASIILKNKLKTDFDAI